MKEFRVTKSIYRRRGKPRLRWLDSIKDATGLHLEALRETVQDRKKWREVEEKSQNRGRTNVKLTHCGPTGIFSSIFITNH
jgi:hypothetical protein